jgi:hypothetical protein
MRNRARLRTGPVFLCPHFIDAIISDRKHMSISGNPIVIVGMQRSGTSSLANALSKLGLFLGKEADFYKADANNEAGYYELDDAIKTNKDILYAYRRPWNHAKPFPENWKEYPHTGDALRQLSALLEKHYGGQPYWGFKEPTTSLLLPLYNQVFENLKIAPRYAICIRNPLDVVVSINRHAASNVASQMETHEVPAQMAGQTFNPPPLGDLALGLWLLLTLTSLREAAHTESTVVLYEDFVLDPLPFLKSIAGSVEGWAPGSEEWEAALGSVKRELRHNARPIEELDKYPPLLKQTYELGQRASRDVEGFRRGDFAPDIEKLWKEFVLSTEMYGTPAPFLGNLVVTWKGNEGVKAVEKAFNPAPCWQKLSLKFNAPKGSFVIGAFYQQPCVVWVKSVSWRAGEQLLPAVLEPGPSCELHKTEDGLLRLFANAEVFQFRLAVPNVAGELELEFELWLEVDPQIVMDGVGLLVANLTGLRGQLAGAQARIQQLQSGPVSFPRR